MIGWSEQYPLRLAQSLWPRQTPKTILCRTLYINCTRHTAENNEDNVVVWINVGCDRECPYKTLSYVLLQSIDEVLSCYLQKGNTQISRSDTAHKSTVCQANTSAVLTAILASVGSLPWR